MRELRRSVQTSFGRIAYDVHGGGPPIVLVHGTPSCAHVWRNVVPALAETHSVHVYDLLGFGASEARLDQDVSVAAHGQVLAELLDRWGLERPVLVGHDIGGAAVLRAHLVEGVPVAKLVLVDAVVLAPWITKRTRAMQQSIDRYRPLPHAELEATIAEHLRSATVTELDRDVHDALFGQWDGADGQARYLRNLAQFDETHTEVLEPLLQTITAPVLLLWGEQDAWLPVQVSAQIAELIPHAERAVLPSAGHFCMEDRPDEMVAALTRFLAQG